MSIIDTPVTQWLGGEIKKDCPGFAGELTKNGERYGGPVAEDLYNSDYVIEEAMSGFTQNDLQKFLEEKLQSLVSAYEFQNLSDSQFAGMAYTLLVAAFKRKRELSEKTKIEPSEEIPTGGIMELYSSKKTYPLSLSGVFALLNISVGLETAYTTLVKTGELLEMATSKPYKPNDLTIVCKKLLASKLEDLEETSDALSEFTSHLLNAFCEER